MMRALRASLQVPVGIFCLATIAACDREAKRVEELLERADPRAEPSFTAVSAAMVPATGGSNEGWHVFGGSYDNTRYSPLTSITPDNVSELVPVWAHQTGISESFTTTPLVVGKTMYLTTPASGVIALNAVTGQELWRYEPELGAHALCCGPNNRGAAAWGDKVYVATLDARLVALDHRTGQVVWETEVADPEEGYSLTMAPLAFDNKVFVGISGGEYGIRGFVTAYDAQTGNQVWRWHTIPEPGAAKNGWWGEWRQHDPFGVPLNRDIAQEQQDSASYPNAWRTGGGAVWMTPAYDPATKTLYFGVGNPSPDLDGQVRPGDNLYTSSIVALDGDNGALRWYFQYLPHNRWDLDPASPPFIFQLDGRKLVGHAAKTGWLYVVDAESGTPVLRSENFVPQANIFAAPTDSGTLMLPGANGGAGWSPAAYSPRTGMAYVLGIHQPMVYTRGSQSRENGQLWLGGSFLHVPGEEQWGTLSAISMQTGRIRWQHRVPEPMVGAALVTASDVLFVGQGHGTFDALDARTGELLWQFNAGAGVHGGPITYTIDGVQYVAVGAGGNYQTDTGRGNTLFVFALPDAYKGTPRAVYERPQYTRTEAMRYETVRQVPAASLEKQRQEQGPGQRNR